MLSASEDYRACIRFFVACLQGADRAESWVSDFKGHRTGCKLKCQLFVSIARISRMREKVRSGQLAKEGHAAVNFWMKDAGAEIGFTANRDTASFSQLRPWRLHFIHIAHHRLILRDMVAPAVAVIKREHADANVALSLRHNLRLRRLMRLRLSKKRRMVAKISGFFSQSFLNLLLVTLL